MPMMFTACQPCTDEFDISCKFCHGFPFHNHILSLALTLTKSDLRDCHDSDFDCRDPVQTDLYNTAYDSERLSMSPERKQTDSSPFFVPQFTPADYGSFFLAGQHCTPRPSCLRAL
jgi:hypothetical protein